VTGNGQPAHFTSDDSAVSFVKDLEARIRLKALASEIGGKLRLRVSLWHNGLPVDALPLEGSIELDVLAEADLAATAF
jgi:hypothetical protein